MNDRDERGARNGPDRAVYIISVAAELAGVHPQTLRIYEQKGLVRPHRTRGNTRRYSEADIERLRRVQRLTQRLHAQCDDTAALPFRHAGDRLLSSVDRHRAARYGSHH